MLILTRYPGEAVEVIADAPGTVTVTVMDVMSNGTVKLGFDGPPHIRFLRDNAIRRRPNRNPQPKEQGYEQGTEEDVNEVERKGTLDDAGNR